MYVSPSELARPGDISFVSRFREVLLRTAVKSGRSIKPVGPVSSNNFPAVGFIPRTPSPRPSALAPGTLIAVASALPARAIDSPSPGLCSAAQGLRLRCARLAHQSRCVRRQCSERWIASDRDLRDSLT
jgi:hypothetical protein